jgi:hypothetical protein
LFLLLFYAFQLVALNSNNEPSDWNMPYALVYHREESSCLEKDLHPLVWLCKVVVGVVDIVVIASWYCKVVVVLVVVVASTGYYQATNSHKSQVGGKICK